MDSATAEGLYQLAASGTHDTMLQDLATARYDGAVMLADAALTAGNSRAAAGRDYSRTLADMTRD